MENHEKQGTKEAEMELYGAPEEGDAPPDYETIMDVPDWKNLPPPPVYEAPPLEGMDKSTPGQAGGEFAPNLGYADFLPRVVEPGDENMMPVYEDFKTVMNIVNHWLSQNPQYLVTRVEDLERKLNIKTQELETETTILHEGIYGHTYFIRGVRLWMVPNTANLPHQQLWYMNIVPKSIPIPIHVYQRMYGGYHHSMGVRAVMYYPNFENLGQTIVAVNKNLKANPLPGRAISVISSDIKYSEVWKGNTFNPDQGCWKNSNRGNKLYLTILRIFFLVGESEPTEIGIQNFAPRITKSGVMMGHPLLEKFESVVQRAAKWLQQQPGIQVTNVQTVDSKVDKIFFNPLTMMIGNSQPESPSVPTGVIQEADNLKIDPGRMHFNDGFFESLFAKTIRICYLKTASTGNMPLPPQVNLSFRDFIPTRYGRTTADTTSQVVTRINDWLHHTGAKVIGVDTIKFLFTPESKYRIRTEDTRTIIQAHKAQYWITVIRVYLDGHYEEPPAEVRPITPPYAGAQGSSGCCTIL